MKPTLENQIKTMEFYRNMAIAMIVFYLDDKKIRYFELYEAFEKLVFQRLHIVQNILFFYRLNKIQSLL